eukprot:COSAG04_NODE_3649_length_2639_cov_1.785827_3_plen_178_part_00
MLRVVQDVVLRCEESCRQTSQRWRCLLQISPEVFQKIEVTLCRSPRPPHTLYLRPRPELRDAVPRAGRYAAPTRRSPARSGHLPGGLWADEVGGGGGKRAAGATAFLQTRLRSDAGRQLGGGPAVRDVLGYDSRPRRPVHLAARRRRALETRASPSGARTRLLITCKAFAPAGQAQL